MSGRAAVLGLSFLHLLVLSAFAIAQPLFDLLGKNAEFFAVRGSPPRDIMAFALAVVFLPALILLACEALAILVSRRAHALLHLAFVAGLAALLAVQIIERLGATPPVLALGGAALLGGAAAFAYARVRHVRTFLTILGPAPLVFLGFFLLGTSVKQLVFPPDVDVAFASVSSRTPIVMIVFDELPLTSLQGADGGIDAVRYPNFAELARDSTWFRTTSTVSGGTTIALPALLTGRNPPKRGLPVFANHPRNLFTLLGSRYRLVATEEMTRLCPRQLCRDTGVPSASRRIRSLARDSGIVYAHLVLPTDLEDRVPAITDTWMDFGAGEGGPAAGERPKISPVRDRANGFLRFVGSIRPSRRPTLFYAHVLLPHQPWYLFPSGRQYLASEELLASFGTRGRWPRDPISYLQGYQRHLLQTQYVDRLLGRLLDRLRESGMYDRSLLVVTSDHGVSFRPGDRRRLETEGNLEDMAFVPLFIRVPGQEGGRIEDRHVRTIDVLPTIADVLGTRIPWPVDGRSAFDGAAPGVVRLGPVSAPLDQLLSRREAALERQVSLFGWGDRPPGLYGLGPHPELIGKAVDALPNAGDASARAEIDEVIVRMLGRVRRNAAVLPAPIAGRINGEDARTGREMAVAVNGRIVAVSRTFASEGSVRFSALVPDDSFRPGSNSVEIFWVTDDAGELSLESLGGAPD